MKGKDQTRGNNCTRNTVLIVTGGGKLTGYEVQRQVQSCPVILRVFGREVLEGQGQMKGLGKTLCLRWIVK